jgi:predicted nucleic acid-binding protein
LIRLFDTSALIVAARDAGAGRVLADALAADEVALCDPILLEYLNGARDAPEYNRFEAGLRATRLIRTTEADWARALEVHRELAGRDGGLQRAVRLPVLIIAATAAREGLPVVHHDPDFETIAAVTGQATRWIVEPPTG